MSAAGFVPSGPTAPCPWSARTPGRRVQASPSAFVRPCGAPVWSFEIGGTKISGGAPEAGEWAYVLGLYDAETGTARLYVNGHETGTAAKATPWAENGNLQIGRARGKDGYRNRWQGEIGDVRVYDRVVVPEELTRLANRAAQSIGHWSLESATDGASPEEQGGQELRLGGGSSIFTEAPECDLLDPDCVPAPSPLNGKGHLELDGNDGYAATKNPVVDTSDSFTLAVRVRLTDREPAGPMTVLSQAGEHANAFKLRYVPAEYRWQLVMTHADAPDAPETVVASIASPDCGEGPGQRLAIVYDDATDQVRLYLDGYTNADATATFRSAWKSTGGLQVGRTTVGDGWGEYLHGAVDEIQAFSRRAERSGHSRARYLIPKGPVPDGPGLSASGPRSRRRLPIDMDMLPWFRIWTDVLRSAPARGGNAFASAFPGVRSWSPYVYFLRRPSDPAGRGVTPRRPPARPSTRRRPPHP